MPTTVMNFEDTPTEAAFRAEARAWLEANAVPKGHPDDFSSEFHRIHAAPPEDQERLEAEHAKRVREWQAKLYEGGWAAVAWPREYGGRGGTAMEARIFAEEQANFGVAVDVFVVAMAMAGPTVMAHGTEAQKRRYLPAMLRGDEIWCQLFSEPGAGSDLASLTTRAVRDGDEWVANGQKVWTSQPRISDQAMLLARTNPDVGKHKGITFFALDMATPGIDVRPLRQMTGESHFAEVFLTDVRVPADAVIGEVDGGWAVARTTLANERAFMGGQARLTVAGLAAAARQQGLGDDRVIRDRLARMYTEEQVLEFLGFRLRTAMSQGRPPGPEANCMKLFMAHHLKRISELALEVAGPQGTLAGDDALNQRWQHLFLHAPSIRIAGGSDEVQRNVIGERVLGLPREPRPA